MVEEPEEVAGRVVQRGSGAHRPHARHQRHRIQPHERVREAVAAEELAVGGLVAVVGPAPGTRWRGRWNRLTWARTDRKRGSSDPARLGEDTLRAAPTGELDAAALVVDAHAHLGRARPHAELAEQPPQVRVRAVVVDDETGVDREPVPAESVTSWVWAWPPRRSSAS